MSRESDAFRAAMADDAGGLAPQTVVVVTEPACQCGCGRPEGVNVTIAGGRMFCPDAQVLDALIDLLADARARVWGARPGKGRTG